MSYAEARSAAGTFTVAVAIEKPNESRVRRRCYRILMFVSSVTNQEFHETCCRVSQGIRSLGIRAHEKRSTGTAASRETGKEFLVGTVVGVQVDVVRWVAIDEDCPARGSNR